MAGQVTVTIKDKRWSVLVANTLAQLATGLAGIESLPDEAGMLFDLGYDQKFVQVDMSRMLFPLDIVFVSSTQGVVGVLHDVEPQEEAYLRNEALPGARCFLEVNAGEAQGIEVGDSVAIEGYAGPAQLGIASLASIMVAVMLMAWFLKLALELPKERPAAAVAERVMSSVEFVASVLSPAEADYLNSLRGWQQFEAGKTIRQIAREENWFPGEAGLWESKLQKMPGRVLTRAEKLAKKIDKLEDKISATEEQMEAAEEAGKDTAALEARLKALEKEAAELDAQAAELEAAEPAAKENARRGAVTTTGRNVAGTEQPWRSYGPQTAMPQAEGEKGAVIPARPPRKAPDELEYLADSPEFLAQTIDAIGYRDRLDSAFREAIARAKELK